MSCPRQRRKSLSPKLTLHFRRLRVCAAIVALCQVISLTGYLYFAGQVAETYAENINVRLEISTAVTATPTPTPEATPTPTPFGGGPPQPLPPQLHPDPYVPGEGTVAPYVYVGMLDGVALQPGDVGTTYAIQPNVIGKTNLADAVVFIESTDTPGVFYTVHANISGIWEFTWPNPLPLGWHTLYLTAISPVDPGKRATATFNFEIIPIPPVPPIVSPTPPTPAVSPTPPTPPVPPTVVPQAPERGLYDLDLKVPPSSQVIIPGKSLDVETKIIPLLPPVPGEETLPITFRIIDASGRTVFSEPHNVSTQTPSTYQPITTKHVNLPPGEYWAVVELQRGTTTYVAMDRFRVATPTLPLLFGLTVPVRIAGDFLLRLSSILALLLFMFFGLMWLEFWRAQKAPQVNEFDLLAHGDILRTVSGSGKKIKRKNKKK